MLVAITAAALAGYATYRAVMRWLPEDWAALLLEKCGLVTLVRHEALQKRLTDVSLELCAEKFRSKTAWMQFEHVRNEHRRLSEENKRLAGLYPDLDDTAPYRAV